MTRRTARSPPHRPVPRLHQRRRKTQVVAIARPCSIPGRQIQGGGNPLERRRSGRCRRASISGGDALWRTRRAVCFASLHSVVSKTSEHHTATRAKPKSWRPPAHAGVGRQLGQTRSVPPGRTSAWIQRLRRRRSLIRSLGSIRVRSLDCASNRGRRRCRLRGSRHRGLRRRSNHRTARRLRGDRLGRWLGR